MTNLALIGAGPMAMAYAAVLKDLNANIRVIGRGEASAATFKEKRDWMYEPAVLRTI